MSQLITKVCLLFLVCFFVYKLQWKLVSAYVHMLLFLRLHLVIYVYM